MKWNKFVCGLRFNILLCFFLVVSISSCVDMPEANTNTNTNAEPSIPLVYSDIDSLRFVSYRIGDTINSRIYSDVYFTLDSTDGKYKASINYYTTDLSSLIATFRSNAKRITVNNVAQVSNTTPNNFNNEVTYRLYTVNGNHKDFTLKLTNSSTLDIPLLVINTKNGQAITSRDIWLDGRIIIDKQSENVEEFRGNIQIKGRGNNSWSNIKKPYTFKFEDKTSLLGMNVGKRWVLLANASDKTLLRNKVALEIAKRTSLAWTPDSRFVNVILNGVFVGNYLLTEKIRVATERVNITEMGYEDNSSESIKGGYLLNIDRYYNSEDVSKFRGQYSDLPFLMEEPDELNTQQYNYIKNYITTIESILYGNNITSREYLNYIDETSFIDYWIINELTHNADVTLPGSVYMYKDRNGKLFAGPVWDFDLTTFIHSTSFKIMDALWYSKLFLDPAFKQKAKQRWQTLKPLFVTIPTYIDQQKAYILLSAHKNWEIYSLNSNGSNQDGLLSWEEAVNKMKENYTYRLNGLDSQISQW